VTAIRDSETTLSRFLIGIDLGTTNSALAYVDTAAKRPVVKDLAIPQLVGPSEIEARDTLPSFHYQAAMGELPGGALRLPWDTNEPRHAVGAFARDHGAAVPGRLVVSAKSWLSHSGVDRTAGLLPWHGAADVERLSPVQVSARYLAHLRAAWDNRFPQHPMASQDVVLCVPASFDEVARELTIDAAREAGLVRIVLLEEPQAAFYAWINAQGNAWEERVKPGQKILVCDVGGGTSDFTLIRVRPAKEGKVLFHRVAVGEHLILGGDNLDLAIAHHVEQKLAGGSRRLEARQWGTLVRACRQVKETLLGSEPPEQAVVNVTAGGSKLIAGSIQAHVTREEIQQRVLEGFLPNVTLEERPAARRSGFQEFGLPYAPDPAITKYLAAFLVAHRDAGLEGDEDAPGRGSAAHDPARPDLVLFNGGLFESPVLRQRLLEVMQTWFRSEGKRAWKPQVLKSDRLDLAVARGAAYYGMVRRGRGVRISGGLAHSYYIGVEQAAPIARMPVGSASADAPRAAYVPAHDRLTAPAETSAKADSTSDVSDTRSTSGTLDTPTAAPLAVCLLPAGVEEGQTVELTDRTFNLLIRQPVEFPLYASSTRTTDKPGTLIAVDPMQLTQLPPIRTVLQSGRKNTAETVSVRLGARLTAIGTLDIWCAEARGDRQWRLQFDVRAATRADAIAHEGAAEQQGVVDERVLTTARQRITAAFSRNVPGVAADRPESLVKRIEEVTGMGRHDWPATLMRGLWEALMDVEPGRRMSDVHEARWLNFTGFCLRPGYGLAADDWRVAQTWKLLPTGVAFGRNELCRAEWWILWRRLGGGLNAGQQRMLAEPLIADWRTWFRKAGSNVKGRSPNFQFGPHESAEVWRLLGSLELLAPETKLELGNMLLERLARESSANLRESVLFALGRLGARVPVYGPLNDLIPIELAEQWAARIVQLNPREEKAAFTLVQLTRRTGDRYRDVSDDTRQTTLDWMTAGAAPDHYRELVLTGGQLQSEEQRIAFGETLPRGLRIE
jgi:molecular chaperone DnaK (HSP70)